ncbi:ribonuclease III [Thermithiobacillus plumbiphilus]|uniref:ribonuclease III n=1 Tax=Thermithiobacillus plumbiphilus TaxID=1729899 RepID=UPI003BF9C10B
MSLASLQTTLGYEFRDPALLRQALTHRSSHAFNNERLEFLGDGVLNFTVADMLYRRYGQAPEGDLSRMRARLVREETLAEIAQRLDLGSELILGIGEQRSGGFRRASILADALEAVLGAIYLDAGFEAVHVVIRRLFGDFLSDELVREQLKDPKTRLQEFLQGRGKALPRYELVLEKGEAHNKSFVARCHVEGQQYQDAEAGSRRKAEQAAAALMLEQLTRVES